MSQYPEPANKLIDQLSQLPGIGRKTAQRLAFYILKSDDTYIRNLSDAINDIKKNILFCDNCGIMSEENICHICIDNDRVGNIICVVEQPVDLASIERTAEYQGLYHVLGGALSPLDGVDPSDLRIDSLVTRATDDEVREVVLATNSTMTGEATASFLAEQLRPHVRVTRPASGLPVGADLEYADEVTLGRALAGRREML